MKNQIISVKGSSITVISKQEEDYISITDIARHKNPVEPKDIVKNWMRSKTTIEFLGLWEKLHNLGFKGIEFDSFMYQAGSIAGIRNISFFVQQSERDMGRGQSAQCHDPKNCAMLKVEREK